VGRRLPHRGTVLRVLNPAMVYRASPGTVVVSRRRRLLRCQTDTSC